MVSERGSRAGKKKFRYSSRRRRIREFAVQQESSLVRGFSTAGEFANCKKSQLAAARFLRKAAGRKGGKESFLLCVDLKRKEVLQMKFSYCEFSVGTLVGVLKPSFLASYEKVSGATIISHFEVVIILDFPFRRSLPFAATALSPGCRCHPFTRIFSCLLLFSFFLNSRLALSDSDYLIGLGSYDITGPAADVNMMGYANTDQITSGIHFRLKARSFIVAEPGGNRVAFVNLDACMASQLVTIKVLERLKSRYGDLYTEQNVAISGIHTHSGPGGYLQYVVYIVTSLGFVRQSFDVIVDGIEKSIIQAHQNLRPGSLYVNKGELDAGINRSPSAYLNNPASERSQYQYNVDKQMTLLKFVDNEWGPVGAFNWFATHGTSMGRTNSLISGDNKGAAARFMEDWAKQKILGTQSRSTHVAVPGSHNNQQRIPRRVSNIIPQVDDNGMFLHL
ncbi:neutral ceramidase-like [Phalaenopsis equestris]|uniref:neutral ceramidase-like n=1 Tax=Phalaenopsis equestris TaxID=78828 RepID=UPI0009E41D5F|nr:neutral ceramidase-like [Phalaenopsis equestris]